MDARLPNQRARSKKERAMAQQAWSRTAIVGDAILLAAAVLFTIVAGAYHISEAAARNADAYIASYDDTDQTDGIGTNPAADGSIVIECMAYGDRVVPDIGESRGSLTPLLVSVPRYQLGPSKCWPDPHKRS
jgi:hypothetical protein